MSDHDHNKENSVTETIAPTPEDIAATSPDESDATVIGPLDDQEALEAYDISPAADPDELPEDEDEEEPTPNAITAFLVIVGPDGAAFATNDLAKLGEILPAREAQAADMRRACQEVVHDVNAMQASQQTVALMQQSAEQMAEAKRNAQIAAKLQSKGIQVPGRGARR